MTIPRSDNPTPIEFDDIRPGDTVEARSSNLHLSQSRRFLVARNKSGTIEGYGCGIYFDAEDPWSWFLHHRPVGLPGKPTFGQATWTGKDGLDRVVTATWHSAHTFHPDNTLYAVSDNGHEVPAAKVTGWEPGAFVSKDDLDRLYASVQQDVRANRFENATIRAARLMFRNLGMADPS